MSIKTISNRFFVKGLSRSGGTLMVTILDAHPNISMGYELYEHLLTPDPSKGCCNIKDIIFQLDQKPKKKYLLRKKKSDVLHPKLKVFSARVHRGGVDTDELVCILQKFHLAGGDIQTTSDRLKLIELIVTAKMLSEGKTNWGVKIAKSLNETKELWPDAHFLFMVRDGRDIAASRKHNGAFNQTIKETADGYVSQIELFKNFSEIHEDKAHFVHYESLATNPKTTLKALFYNLGLPWHDSVLQHHEADLTLFKNPTGHLSANQVNKPINTNSVGRWKHDLSPSEASEFESIAGDCLEEFGYVCGQAAE